MISDGSSTLPPNIMLALGFVVIVLFSFMKNYLLNRTELSRSLSKEVVPMHQPSTFILISASILETMMSIAASNWTSAGSLI